ncbi:hypothetical protein FBU59_001732 [Linderina macrospora]|uniref:Uncharacterized protein n=1 Tax=Linderina macrospora TaxID=4868 RepID=A0ACC1JDC0_9FUNG|nr:hypothetical protein FBU59_001732 [Linderina macrospora]
MQNLAGLGVPQTRRVVGRTRHHKRAWLVDVDRPQSSLVASVRAHALSVVRVPQVRSVILRDRQQKVAVLVVLDLGQRTRVSLQQNGPLHQEKQRSN